MQIRGHSSWRYKSLQILLSNMHPMLSFAVQALLFLLKLLRSDENRILCTLCTIKPRHNKAIKTSLDLAIMKFCCIEILYLVCRMIANVFASCKDLFRRPFIFSESNVQPFFLFHCQRWPSTAFTGPQELHGILPLNRSLVVPQYVNCIKHLEAA